MSLKSFCSGLYRFFTWPFRIIWRCFSKEQQPTPEVTTKPVIKTPPIIPDRGIRVLRLDDDAPVVAHTKFKPLFLPDHFDEAKNDKDFKEAREKARKKEERIKYRKELMERIKKMDENLIEKIKKAEAEEGLRPIHSAPAVMEHEPDSP